MTKIDKKQKRIQHLKDYIEVQEVDYKGVGGMIYDTNQNVDFEDWYNWSLEYAKQYRKYIKAVKELEELEGVQDDNTKK